jgi:hypothetical protein
MTTTNGFSSIEPLIEHVERVLSTCPKCQMTESRNLYAPNDIDPGLVITNTEAVVTGVKDGHSGRNGTA